MTRNSHSCRQIRVDAIYIVPTDDRHLCKRVALLRERSEGPSVQGQTLVIVLHELGYE